MPFVTSDDPRRAHETCWLLDVTSLTNPLDLVISSPKTKGPVIPQAEWSSSEDSATVSQGRSNVNIQSTPDEWAVRKVGGGGRSHRYFGSHSLKVAELDTRVSAYHICPFNRFTFFGITFHLKIL